MKKVELKDIKIGDFIYIIEHLFIEKNKNRRFILKILLKKGELTDTYFWRLKNTSKKASIFDPIELKGDYTMDKKDWENYNLKYKLNKEEVSKFIKLLIIDSL